MGLLSLFSSRKGKESTRQSTGKDAFPERGRRSRTDSAAAPRGRMSSASSEYADDTLDPDFPQKQRARRRLIGAVVLLAVAIIVLPIIFEHKPRPVSEDIAVKVANGQATGQKPKVEPRKADPLPPAASSRNDAALDAGEEIVNAPAAAKPADAKPADAKPAEAKVAEAKVADKPADKASGSGKYLILIGAFSSEERAKNWLAKLKESKVPAYVEKKTLADGERNLLRAGPFSDREAAESAEKRIRAIGLTSKLVEQ
ncbi:SPOR domain-containing protein [Cupriavidus plantarum]|uniref:SPOR domain-containing protein n=1 Tax=Cupriavidus plantarum TaxID=942865 RepID=UPI0015C7192C|nr:SPOR domain-containing protein [Cupriavidus plantarum]